MNVARARIASPPYSQPHVLLYHGTTQDSADAIVTGGVQVSMGMPIRDFGPGFYTTTDRHQARRWAEIVTRRRRRTAPGIVEIAVDRDQLATLDALAFVRRDRWADNYWEFVQYCRLGAIDHARGGRSGAYFDVVYGPFSLKWALRRAAPGGDQISFHTSRAEDVLNASARRQIALSDLK